MKKGIVPIISMIIGVVFILVAFFGPWYSDEMKFSMAGIGETDYHQDMYLTKLVVTGTMMGEPIQESTDYDDIQSLPMSAQVPWLGHTFAIFDNTWYFTIGLIITSILALIGILGFIFGKANIMRKMGIIFGIVTFILAIIVVCYFAISLNNVFAEQGFTTNIQGETEVYDIGFFSSINTNEVAISSGPGFAWYLMIVAGITSLISSVAIYKTSSVIRVVPTEEKKQKEIITIMKHVKCSSCGKVIKVKGIANTRKEVICPECHTKGFCQFLR